MAAAVCFFLRLRNFLADKLFSKAAKTRGEVILDEATLWRFGGEGEHNIINTQNLQ